MPRAFHSERPVLPTMSNCPELERLLSAHAQRYPLMEPTDAVKLIYQNEFGGGHLVQDEKKSLDFLFREWGSLSREGEPDLTEEIGNGRCRLNLAAVDPEKLPLELINRVFAESSRTGGEMEPFQRKLACLTELAEKGKLPFSGGRLGEYLTGYAAAGYPAVSHSAAYRDAYPPAYRVIDARYVRLFPLIAETRRLLAEKGTVVVGIDGMAASGKTTAAQLLAALFDANVIHMDDFFLPLELRTEERLKETGGNVHYERFREEVVQGLAAGKEFCYRIFDCGECDYTQTVSVKPKALTIVEGAYCLHPCFGDIFDLKVFSGISGEEQSRRILKRNGERMLKRFEECWIPMENRYIREFGIREKCDIRMEQ